MWEILPTTFTLGHRPTNLIRYITMSNKHKHAPRHNKIALTHDKGLHAERVLKNAKKELSEGESKRPPSRAWCLGRYYPLHQL